MHVITMEHEYEVVGTGSIHISSNDLSDLEMQVVRRPFFLQISTHMLLLFHQQPFNCCGNPCGKGCVCKGSATPPIPKGGAQRTPILGVPYSGPLCLTCDPNLAW